MKKTTRKLIAGTLLCTMAFSGMPALAYGDETFTYVHAAEAEKDDVIFSVQQVAVSYPYTFPMGEHLEEGIDIKDCTFGTTDSSVAIVNEAGVVIPLSNGSVEITVTTKDGKKDTCPLRVVDNENVAYTLQDRYTRQGTITGPIPLAGRNEKIHKSSVLRIASKINEDYQVKNIAANAFENADHLETVVLPESYIIVESKAFAHCKNLKTVIVPDMDTSFEEDVFEGDEIILKGYEGSEAEKYAKQYDNITFEILDPQKDDYAPYEEAIYFSKENRLVEEKLLVSAGVEENLYPAVASLHYGVQDITYTSEDSNIVSIKDGILIGKKAGTTKVTASLPSGVKKVIDVTVEGEAVSTEETDIAATPATEIPETEAPVTETPATETPVTETPATETPATETPETEAPAAESLETEAPVTEVSTTETPTTEQDTISSPEVQKQSSAHKIRIKITSKKANIKVGKSYQFRAVAFYTKEKLQWSVSNKKIASINKTTGKLKAKKAGKVTVTVTCNDVVKKLQVNVKK